MREEDKIERSTVVTEKHRETHGQQMNKKTPNCNFFASFISPPPQRAYNWLSASEFITVNCPNTLSLNLKNFANVIYLNHLIR